MHILQNHGDGVICIFPSDHYITNNEAYMDILKEAINLADRHSTISVIGVKPTYPSTGYGYIKIGRNKVERFVEKPGIEKANEYIKDGSYYWNAGVFIAKASVLIGLFERFLPKIYHELKKAEGRFGSPEGDKLLEGAYNAIDGISFDYGIMERLDNALAVTGDFGWSDVGSWDALGAVFPPDKNGNIVNAEHMGIDTKESVIYGNNRLIATIGLSDVVIVDTEDALLVCRKDRAQEIKKIVDEFSADCKKTFGDDLADARLFGSCARGDYNDGSDIDVMLLFNMSRKESNKHLDAVCRIAAEISMKYGVWLSPNLQSKPEYDANKKVYGFYKNVEREGMSVYAG
jgi:mannose-1-phosphate guanylyltransferase